MSVTEDYLDKQVASDAGPQDYPEDHAIKTTCGRIAGGLVETVSTRDLLDLRGWLNATVIQRELPKSNASPF